jgi:FkbM family methyltransferase
MMWKKILMLLESDDPVWLATAALLRRSRLCMMITIQRRGYRLRFFPSSLSSQFWRDPTARVHEEDFIKSLLCPGNTYVDVGANIGSVALTAWSVVGPSGKIVAIEPHPRIFRYMTTNFTLNGLTNAYTFNVAVGAKSGEAILRDQRSDDQNSVIAQGSGIRIKVEALDNLAAELPLSQIDVLKIDAEGSELGILTGAAATLGKTRCVYCECHRHHCERNGYQQRDLVELLGTNGFALFMPAGPEGQQYAGGGMPREGNMLVRLSAHLPSRTMLVGFRWPKELLEEAGTGQYRVKGSQRPIWIQGKPSMRGTGAGPRKGRSWVCGVRRYLRIGCDSLGPKKSA